MTFDRLLAQGIALLRCAGKVSSLALQCRSESDSRSAGCDILRPINEAASNTEVSQRCCE